MSTAIVALQDLANTLNKLGILYRAPKKKTGRHMFAPAIKKAIRDLMENRRILRTLAIDVGLTEQDLAEIGFKKDPDSGDYYQFRGSVEAYQATIEAEVKAPVGVEVEEPQKRYPTHTAQILRFEITNRDYDHRGKAQPVEKQLVVTQQIGSSEPVQIEFHGQNLDTLRTFLKKIKKLNKDL